MKFDRSGEFRKMPFPEPQNFIADFRDRVKIIALRKSDNLQDYKILEQTKKLTDIQTTHLKWVENNEIGGGPLRVAAADKLKRQEDFLSLTLNKHYNYTLGKKSTYNDSPVYVIKFKPKDSLDVKAHYRGEISIDEASKAIVSYSYWPTDFARKRLNQKFATQLKTPSSVEESTKKKFISRVTELKDYEVIVNYTKSDTTWHLKRIKLINYYKNHGDFLKNYDAVTESELVVNDIAELAPVEQNVLEDFPSAFMNSIFGYELAYDSGFWKNYNALVPTDLLGKALKDLEAETSLEEQFQSTE